jgi:hypothetical protein
MSPAKPARTSTVVRLLGVLAAGAAIPALCYLAEHAGSGESDGAATVLVDDVYVAATDLSGSMTAGAGGSLAPLSCQLAEPLRASLECEYMHSPNHAGASWDVSDSTLPGLACNASNAAMPWTQWQTSWYNDAALASIDGTVLPCLGTYVVDLSRVFGPDECQHADGRRDTSHGGASWSAPAGSDRAGSTLCAVDITALFDAWRTAPHDDITGHRVGPVSLLRFARTSRYTGHYTRQAGKARRDDVVRVMGTRAREVGLLRLYNAAVSAQVRDRVQQLCLSASVTVAPCC